jgi:hypothetical protein
MSLLTTQEHRCSCGATVELKVADSINASRHPHLREAVLDGTLHRYECQLCHQNIVVERQLFYFDFDRRQFFCVFPVSELVEASARARATHDMFEKVIRRESPAHVRQVAAEFFVRACFGYDELREKLLCDQHALSDLALEHLKLRILISDPRFAQNAIGTLWLARVTRDYLSFHPAPLEPAGMLPPVTVERAIYDEVASAGDVALYAARPALASGPHVSLLRLVRWAASGS